MMVHCIQAPETKSMHLCLTFAFSLSMSINIGPGKVSEGRLGILSWCYKMASATYVWPLTGVKNKIILLPVNLCCALYVDEAPETERYPECVCEASLCLNMKALFFSRLAFLLYL
jgi:hypothetical protein